MTPDERRFLVETESRVATPDETATITERARRDFAAYAHIGLDAIRRLRDRGILPTREGPV